MRKPLLQDLGDDAGADGLATLADRKPQKPLKKKQKKTNPPEKLHNPKTTRATNRRPDPHPTQNETNTEHL
jgi:hypothetical protein